MTNNDGKSAERIGKETLYNAIKNDLEELRLHFITRHDAWGLLVISDIERRIQDRINES